MRKRLFAILVLIIVSLPLAAEESVLTWRNGDTLSGTLIGADENVLTWQSTLFTDPLKIQLSTLASVGFPKSKTSTQDDQGFRILMKNGDMLFGNLTGISDKTLSFEGSRLGKFELARDQILSLQQAKSSAGLLYSGPRGLDGWQPAFRRANSQDGQVQPIAPLGIRRLRGDMAAGNPNADKSSAWKEQPDGTLTTTRSDAALFLPLQLPEKFEIEIELSSKKTLSFVMAVGRDAKSGLRLESWIDVLVAANGTTFATLQQISNKAHTLHLYLFVDYSVKKMLVYAPDGRKLGEVPISGLRGAAQGITLRNGEWDLSLRRLQISHWDGIEPQFVDKNKTRIQLKDGTKHFGVMQSFKSETGVVTVQKDGQSLDLSLADIRSAVLFGDNTGPVHSRGAAQLLWQDGGVVSGSVVSIAEEHAVIRTEYSDSPLKCNLSNALRLGLTPAAAEKSTPSDQLFHAAGSLQGSLVVDGEGDAPIQWKPLGGINASTLKNGGEARFVRGPGMTHFSDAPELLGKFVDVIYLKNNDVLPCRIESCTEDAVHLSMPFSSVRSFTRSDVRAVELSAIGRIHQKGFGATGWKGVVAKKVPRSPVRKKPEDAPEVPQVTTQLTQPEDATSVITLKGNASVSHPDILTGDTVRFRLRWPMQSYSNLTVSLFGSGSRTDEVSTHVAFSLMQATMQVLDRAPAPDKNQMAFRGFGGLSPESIIRVPDGEADVQIVAQDGNLLVSVNGKQVKTIALNAEGAGSKGLAFNANVTMMGNVVINGWVQNSGDGIEISAFEIDNLSGASIRQFIEEETRQVALTVPRFRRDNPPSHVLVAANGDLLRGRMVALNDNDVQFESRLETLRISRSRIAAIVWLDPAAKDSGKKPPKAKPADAAAQANPAEEMPVDESAPPADVVGELLSAIGFEKTDQPEPDAEAPAIASPATAEPDSEAGDSNSTDSENGFVMGEEADSSMQAHLADGFRITMTPARRVDGHIHGHSNLLGDCSFPAATIRELFVGNANGQTHSTAYENWIAKNTQDPDWDIPADAGGSSAGAEMIGTVADDFELPLLDGTKFRLKDHADKIIVLDFWATWCGPCVAALPDYIAATSRFDSTQVIFVAVNQQESSDQIRSFLAERDLSPIVALDRDGAIGTSFKVTGIPHTVILGKGNVIEDVHVGYQQGGGESMQVAIQQLLDGTWKRQSAQAEPPADPPNPKPPDSI